MTSTRAGCHLNASRRTVYRALLDPEAIARWRFPAGMTCVVHEFDGREGGRLRIFETTDPALQGEMTITIRLADADGGTDLLALHEGLPSGVCAADNEAGWARALARLATLVEAG